MPKSTMSDEEEECLPQYRGDSCDDSGFLYIGDDPLNEIFHYSRCKCQLWYRDFVKEHVTERDLLIRILDVLHEIKTQL